MNVIFTKREVCNFGRNFANDNVSVALFNSSFVSVLNCALGAQYRLTPHVEIYINNNLHFTNLTANRQCPIYQSTSVLSSFPGLPRFCSLICVQYNKRKLKSTKNGFHALLLPCIILNNKNREAWEQGYFRSIVWCSMQRVHR